MGRTFIIFACTLLAICITNIHSSEEGKERATPGEIVITDEKSMKTIEVRNPSNATLPESPTVIQQGNNVYIKPKFIFGSPFTSYKQGRKSDKCCENISVTTKVPDEETSIVVGTPPTPQVPAAVIPPITTPTIIEDDISVPPPRFPVQPQTPIVILNPCQNIPWVKVPNVNIPMACPPFIVPSSPNPPQLPRFPPQLPRVPNPIRPVVIPKPPELPPMVLPKLPIQVSIKNPIDPNPPVIRPISDQPYVVVPPCPPMVNCNPPRQALPSISDMFGSIFEKIKNSLANRLFLSSFSAPDEEVAPDLLFPTRCAQGIIAERVVPNIVKNGEGKVILSPIFPSQSSFYEK